MPDLPNSTNFLEMPIIKYFIRIRLTPFHPLPIRWLGVVISTLHICGRVQTEAKRSHDLEYRGEFRVAVR